MALNVGELFATMGLDASPFTKELKKAVSDVDKSTKGIAGSITKGMVGYKLLETGVRAVTGAVKSTISAGKSFESAVSGIAAVMGKTVDEISGLEDMALELGSTTRFTASAAAEGITILAQAGLEEGQIMSSIKDVLNLAAAGGIEMGTAASYVTTAVRGFGDEFENASTYVNIMARGTNLANTDVNMFGRALSGASATAKMYGQDVKGVSVALLRMANNGKTGSEATTMLNRAMQVLYAPTKKQKEIMDSLGFSAYDATGETKEFNAAIDELNGMLGGISDNQQRNMLINQYSALVV